MSIKMHESYIFSKTASPYCIRTMLYSRYKYKISPERKKNEMFQLIELASPSLTNRISTAFIITDRFSLISRYVDVWHVGLS